MGACATTTTEERDRHLAGHRLDQMELREIRELLNYEVTPAPPPPKKKRGGPKKARPTGPVIAVHIDPTIQKEMTRERSNDPRFY